MLHDPAPVVNRWVANTVGYYNRKFFVLFLFYTMLSAAMLAFLCALSFYNLVTSPFTKTHMNQEVSMTYIWILSSKLSLCIV